MGWGRYRYRQSTQHGYPLVETEQLDRNLSLVVIHAERAVIVSITHLEIEGVAGEGAGDIDLMLFGFANGGLDDVDFFSPDSTAIAGVWV